MLWGTRYSDEDEDDGARGLFISWRLVGRVLKVGLGVGVFSVIAGLVIAENAQHGGDASKAAWFPSQADRDAMERAAATALVHDIPTGSIKLDPCALPKK